MNTYAGLLFMNIIFTLPDYILFFVSIFNLILAVFIFINEPKNKVNIWFSAFAFCMCLWAMMLLLFRNVPFPYAHFFMRNSYLSAIGIAISFWYFIHFFPRKRKLHFLNSTLPLILTLILLALFLNPSFISKEVLELANGERTVLVDTFGYIIFSVHFLFFFFGAIILLWLVYRKEKGILKKHSQLLMYSVLFAGSFGVFFNLILPSPFFQNFKYIHLGPLFTFFIVLAVSYGVAKYQLMNIKALITEFFVVVLILIQIIQVFFAKTMVGYISSLSVLFAVIVIGFLLIKSVLKEVKRREEITKLARSLEKANIRLKELDQQKTDFLSIASHQLRTPLSIISGYIELIKDKAYGKTSPKINKIFDNIEESVVRLVNLIDEFLDTTRLEQGRTSFFFKQEDLCDITKDVVKEIKSRPQSKDLSIEIKQLPKICKVVCDEEKIRHVLLNYVDNATKYTQKGSVNVFLKSKKRGISCAVKDTGIGFTREDGLCFFQKFYRGKNVKGVNINGTGMGLYVCKKFIEAHGGHVWAKSPGLHKGSEFGFWIPLKPRKKIINKIKAVGKRAKKKK